MSNATAERIIPQHDVSARHNSWRPTKYYRFNGQVVAMRKNGVLTYLHGDHLSSNVLTTNGGGNFSGQELRHAYDRYRGGTELGTENRFTAPRGPRNWMTPG